MCCSSSQHDEVKHKIFISHSGAQKDFAEQLCLDLERRGFIFPFFDQRHHSLPKGKYFVPLIKEAAPHCLVAVILLSEDFLCSKWPMIELAEFHGAQQAENQRLNMLPLFYKLSVKDLGERAVEERWMPTWRQLASGDERIDVHKWSAAVRALRKVNGLVFGQEGPSRWLTGRLSFKAFLGCRLQTCCMAVVAKWLVTVEFARFVLWPVWYCEG